MNNYKPKLTTLLPLQNRHAQLQLSFRNWKVSVAGSQAKPGKRDYSSESSALRPFRTKLVPGSWHRSAKSSFQRSARAQGQSTEGHFCSTFHSLLQQARKVGQVWGAPVRESYKQLENQTKLLPPSLQPSVAISSPPQLICQGSDCGNRPCLGHFSLVYLLTGGLLANCLAHHINTLIAWGEGWAVYRWANPPRRSRLIFQQTFYVTMILSPTSSLVATALISMAGKVLVPTGQMNKYSSPSVESVMRISFFTAAHLWLIKCRLLLWLYVSLRDRAMIKNVECNPCPKTITPLRTWPLPSPDRKLLHCFTMNL